LAVQFVLPDRKSVSQPPSAAAYIVDRTFFFAAAVAIIALVVYILWEIGGQALPAIGKSGASFLVNTRWDVQNASFGILPQIWGTLYSSLLALLIGGFRSASLKRSKRLRPRSNRQAPSASHR
jgi:phosphate transport system permease protein